MDAPRTRHRYYARSVAGCGLPLLMVAGMFLGLAFADNGTAGVAYFAFFVWAVSLGVGILIVDGGLALLARWKQGDRGRSAGGAGSQGKGSV